MDSRIWDKVDAVILDMDGTILDLSFDNYFWMEFLPEEYRKKHGIDEKKTALDLSKLYDKYHGTLSWYCIDFWSSVLDLDVLALKKTVIEVVDYRPGSLEFLQAVAESDKKLYLATNAHPDTLAAKLAIKDFSHYFDALLSSHETGYPKEDNRFWDVIKMKWNLNSEHCIFVDDTLPVLEKAQENQIGHVYGVSRPDLKKPLQNFDGFTMIDKLSEILPDNKS